MLLNGKTLNCKDACRKLILHWVKELVGNPDDAEDLCQEICLRCILKRPSFRNDANFSTWLYRVAVNVVKDFLRKRSRQAEWLETEIDDEMLWEAREAQLWRLTITTEKQCKVQGALSQLTEHQQQLLVWKYVWGYTHAEIAQRLGISEQSAWQAIHRAKRAFIRAYGALESKNETDNRKKC